MLQQGDPNEPKMKSRIVDAMLPLLSDIKDGIEREAYVQEIAQELELDARVLLDRLRAMERAEAVRSQAAVREARSTGGESRSPRDMEAHVLTVLMQHPEVRARVDALLGEAELEPIREEDFSNQYRLIWSSWVEMLEHPELELEDFLPSDILEVVQGWLAQGLPEMSLAQWERDVMRTILRMRERNLRQILNETRVLLQYVRPEDEDNGGQYRLTVSKLTNHMWRIQQALAQRPV
jgi:DNA primase